jgi:hypothetical protein
MTSYAFNTLDLANMPTIVNWVVGTPTQILILQAGYYHIGYFGTYNSGAVNQYNFQVAFNGTLLPGSFNSYNDINMNELCCSFFANLNTTGNITFQTQSQISNGGSITLSAGLIFWAELLAGPPGPTGPTGSTGPTGTSSYMAVSRSTNSTGGPTGPAFNIPIIATGATGTLVPYSTTLGVNYSSSGSWTIGADAGTITIPITGNYEVTYIVSIYNNAGATRIVSSCLRVNGTIVSGGGGTLELPTTNVLPLPGQQIISVSAGAQITVYVLASGNNVFIMGGTSLYATDNTSTILTIQYLR